jgi:hypothetical protein
MEVFILARCKKIFFSVLAAVEADSGLFLLSVTRMPRAVAYSIRWFVVSVVTTLRGKLLVVVFVWHRRCLLTIGTERDSETPTKEILLSAFIPKAMAF